VRRRRYVFPEGLAPDKFRVGGGRGHRPWAPAQPLRHGHSQAREGERVDPGPLGRRAERVRESLVREVRANLLAGVTPSEAAIVDEGVLRLEVSGWWVALVPPLAAATVVMATIAADASRWCRAPACPGARDGSSHADR
jgi:hypothetical protein